MRVLADGSVPTDPLALTDIGEAADAPSIAANGRGWGVMWHSRECYPGHCVWFAAIDAAGHVQGTPVGISDPQHSL